MTTQITHRPLMRAGRKAKHPPSDAAAKIEALAADGWSIVGIAKHLGTSTKVLSRWLEENPALQEAINIGREEERWQLHNMLFKKAVEKGDTTAAAIILNARHGYRSDQSEIGNKLNITFNLPGAVSMTEFQNLSKVIEHGEPVARNQPVSTTGIIVSRGA